MGEKCKFRAQKTSFSLSEKRSSSTRFTALGGGYFDKCVLRCEVFETQKADNPKVARFCIHYRDEGLAIAQDRDALRLENTILVGETVSPHAITTAQPPRFSRRDAHLLCRAVVAAQNERVAAQIADHSTFDIDEVAAVVAPACSLHDDTFTNDDRASLLYVAGPLRCGRLSNSHQSGCTQQTKTQQRAITICVSHYLSPFPVWLVVRQKTHGRNQCLSS